MTAAKRVGKLVLISVAEVVAAMFLFLLPANWAVLPSAETALFLTVLFPRSYLVIAFVTLVNVALWRGAPSPIADWARDRSNRELE